MIAEVYRQPFLNKLTKTVEFISDKYIYFIRNILVELLSNEQKE